MDSITLEFRPLTDPDIPLLHEWLGRPHLLQWWAPETSLEQVREKYLPRIAGTKAANPYLAFDGKEPIGYVQSYSAFDGEADYWPDVPFRGVLGIDLFIADGDRLGQGLGTILVSQFVAFLMTDQNVTEVRVDPRSNNFRAIRCYAKAGFQEIEPLTTPDGPAVMMVLTRSSLERIDRNRRYRL